MAVDTLIVGGTVVSPETTRRTSVAIDDGKIVAVGARDALPSASTVIDATDRVVMPGVVDPHAHIDDMFSMDSYESATAAAALGGVTTCIDFGWQAWVGEDSPFDTERPLMDGVDRKRAKIDDAIVDVGLHGGITREDPAVLDELDAAVDAGVTSFKMYSTYEMGVSYGFMERVFERLSDLGAVAVVHTEDDSVCETRTARLQEQERGDPTDYPEARPDYAEAMAASDAVRLATEHGCKYYGFHTTSEAAATELARYRERYGPELVRAETCTHYTALDESVYAERGNLAMLAPPIRPASDREALVDHLRRGTLDVVSSDHCGYTRERKATENWWDSAFGANGLQTELPVLHDELVVRRGLSYPLLVRLKCSTPARLFGFPNKGTLDPGTDADVVLLDPTTTETVTADDNASVADFTLFEGREVTGTVETVLVRGEPVVRDGDLVGSPGHGSFVDREIPTWDPSAAPAGGD
ncbi:MAG: dihydroorotase family protein [Haloplanus sp.]